MTLQPIYIETLPHTGTHTIREFLGTLHVSRLISIPIPVDGGEVPSRGFSCHIPEVIEGRESLQNKLALILQEWGYRSSRYVPLCDHIPVSVGDRPFTAGISELRASGYRAKTVTCLRHPVLTLVTALSQTPSSIGRLEVSGLVGKGFECLDSWVEDPSVFFIRVDSWPGVKPRLDVLRVLVEKFLGVPMTHQASLFGSEWEILHSTIEYTRGILPKEEYDVFSEIRRRIHMGLPYSGLHHLIDKEDAFYATLSGLQEVLEHSYSPEYWKARCLAS